MTVATIAAVAAASEAPIPERVRDDRRSFVGTGFSWHLTWYSVQFWVTVPGQRAMGIDHKGAGSLVRVQGKGNASIWGCKGLSWIKTRAQTRKVVIIPLPASHHIGSTKNLQNPPELALKTAQISLKLRIVPSHLQVSRFQLWPKVQVKNKLQKGANNNKKNLIIKTY